MGFETKKALLEHLGKNPNDNKLVDRMMRRGEVYLEEGMYYLVESEEVVKLKERIKELEKSDLRWELEYAKTQWEYYQGLYESERLDKEYRLEKAFQWIKAHVKWVSWDEFHEWVMSDEESF